VFGWAVAIGKAVVSFDFLKSNIEKVTVGKAKTHLVTHKWLLKKASLPVAWTPHVIQPTSFSFPSTQQ
jgi:hypothetical protein